MSAYTVPVIFQVIDKMTAIYDKMGNSTEKFAARAERAFKKTAAAAENVAKKTAIMGMVVAAPLIMMANSAIAFEDKMADIGKTTGLSGKGLAAFGDDILKMSTTTRTSIDDLLKIGEIGGQFGIAQKDLVGFTDSVNKFNVALGADFSGGVEEAVSQVSSIYGLFKQTKGLKVDEAILKIGSSINELGAQGSGTSANIAEFSVRIGALPDAIKPVMTDVAALGTFFEENGLKAEIASGGLTNFFLVAGKNVGGFGKQMHMSAAQARELLNQNPTEFAKEFASSLEGMSSEQLALKLHDLKIGTQETIKVLGSLSSGTERLTALQKISADAFAEGTSLTNEYNKKNNDSAANIKKLQNQFQALAITIGTELLPVVSAFLEEVTPILKSMMEWVKQNKATVVIILKVAAAVAAFLLVISGVATIIAGITTALGFLSAAIGVLTAVSWPLVLLILIIVAAIALIIGAIYLLYKAIQLVLEKWNEWGAVAVAAMAAFAAPLAFIILMVQSLRRNWDGIIEAFTNGGIIEGLKMIGATMLDAILMPLSQAIELIAKITGADWATGALKQVEDFRKQIGINVTTEEDGSSRNAPILTTETEKHEAITRLLTEQRQKASLEINDNTGNAKLSTDSDLVPITLRSTKRSDF